MRHLFLKLAISGIAVLTPAWAMCSDQDTANQIAANLKNSGKLKGYEINVRVQDGTAQLDGHVRDARQLQYAMAIAGQTAGIEEVINGLTVKPDGRSQKLPVARPVQRASAEEIPNDELILGSPAASPMSPTMTELAAPQMPAPLADAPIGRPAAAPRLRSNNNRPLPMHIPGRGAPMPMDAAMMQASHQPELVPAGPGAAPSVAAPGNQIPPYANAMPAGAAPARYDHANVPNYAWPSYAAPNNYAQVNYPKQYSPTAWPFIGPFYPYPQVPLGWRKVSLEWDNGWWMLDFKD